MSDPCFRLALIGIAGSLCLAGCATKKYVAKQVSPVEGRVSQVEKTAARQGATLETVETGLARTREKLLDVESGLKQTNDRALEAGKSAAEAGQRAGEAGSAAAKAQQSATDARGYAENRSNEIVKLVDGMDKYRLTQSAQVLFAAGRSNLDDQAKSALDTLAKQAQNRRRFVFEVQGFTDSTGSAAQNLVLSQKRAEAVVRYLSLTHKIPLRSIHQMGAGDADPVGDNKTREGRRQNRRVEIRLYTPEMEVPAGVTSAHSR